MEENIFALQRAAPAQAPTPAAPPKRRSVLRRIGRWSAWGLAGLGSLVLLLGLAVLAVLLATLPSHEGERRLAGLQAPVEVLRDARAIPTIRAASEADAAFALGYVHAQDRLFQMEMGRRAAAGRLAELVGSSALRLDRTMRLLGVPRLAEADVASLPADTRALLEAYAAGVNARIEETGLLGAPEFVPLGVVPEPWRPADSMAWGRVMGLWLGGNWRAELERLRLLQHAPLERVLELTTTDLGSQVGPDAPQGALRTGAAPLPVSPTLAAAMPRVDAAHLERLAASLPEPPLPDTASNIWAVTGPRSATGAPILANDPHLGFQQPIMWMLARIELPGRTIEGATWPGSPFVLLGQNGDLAWGLTTTHSDTQDLFVETLDSQGRYLTPDGPRDFEVREERILIRGGRVETLRVRTTRHGPVLSDLDATGAPPGVVLSVAMAALAPGDGFATAMHRLGQARTLDEAAAAARLHRSPQQNVLVASREGIALFVPGRVPLRREGDGRMPVDGASGRFDWRGWVPPEQLPVWRDPTSNRLVNANNRLLPNGHPVLLTRDWQGDGRFRRLVELLDAPEPATVERFLAFQRDEVSLESRDLARALVASMRRIPLEARLPATWLERWDGSSDGQLQEPLVLHHWAKRFRARVLAAGLGPEGAKVAGEPGHAFLRWVLTNGRHWCGPSADCGPLASESLVEAVRDLRARHGEHEREWRWQKEHEARFGHPMLRFVPVLGAWFGTALPAGGDDYTVNRAGMRLTGARPFDVAHGAGYRGVYDLADPSRSRFVIATGQSGHPLSRHYRDQAPLWSAGQGLALRAPAPGEAKRLALLPGG